jgi:AraC-like DNA-binding protein
MPIVEQHFKLLWDMVHQEPFSQDNVNLLTRSLLIYVDRQHGQAMMNRPTNRQQETMRRFLSLVSLHAAKERNIPFYAEKLCIAPHYLSTLVKQESDRTVMQWINQTAVKEIKVWLAYSDESIAQISERLLFPCPASLTKFFKRETGMTPGQYRALGIQA